MGTLEKKRTSGNGLRSYTNPFDRFFRNDFMDLWDRSVPMTVPSINISETKNSFKVELAAPGLKKEDINIDVDGNMLTISCEKESETSNGNGEGENDQVYSRREYNYSSFSRSFTIPDNADGEKIKAKYENGVLNLDIPKKKAGDSDKKQKIRID